MMVTGRVSIKHAGDVSLTAPQAEAIAAKAELAVEPDRLDYCLEAIAEPEGSRASQPD
jgi:hypothetical protein